MLVTFLNIPVWAGPDPLLGTCPILLGTRDMGRCLLAVCRRDQHPPPLLECQEWERAGWGTQ